MTFGEPALCRHPRADIGLARLAGGCEIDRKEIIAGFRRLAEDRVGKDFGVGPDFRRKPSEGDPIKHAIGVVGDEHDRTCVGTFGESTGIVSDIELQQSDRSGKKAFAVPDIALMPVIEILQPALAA